MYKLLLVSIRASSAVWVATSVHRQPFVPLHLCNDSHLCCCICASTAICAVASVHRQPFVPLHRATALCGCLYASLHNDSVRPLSCILARPAQCEFAHSTKKSRAMPVCVSGSVAGVSNCGRLGRCIVQRLCATAIVHPCTIRKLRVRPPAPKKQGYTCLW